MDSARHTELLKRVVSTSNSVWVIDPPTAVKDMLHGLEQPVRHGWNEVHWTCGDYSILFFFLFSGPGHRWLLDLLLHDWLLIFTVYGISEEVEREDWAYPVPGRSPPWPVDSVYNLHTITYTILPSTGGRTPVSVYIPISMNGCAEPGGSC